MTDLLGVLLITGCEYSALDFASLCKLGFSSRYLQTDFQKIRRVYLRTSLKMMRWTLPIQVRWVTVGVRNNTFTEATLKWWLDSVLSSNCEIHCTVECGRVTKHQWVALCAYMYRFMQRRGELRVPLHIFVDGFKAHKQAPCRCPTELAWVAENAYLFFYRSSRITIGTPNINLSSRWVLDRIGDPMW